MIVRFVCIQKGFYKNVWHVLAIKINDEYDYMTIINR